MKEKKKSDTSRYVGNSSEDIVMLGESKNDGFIKEEEKKLRKRPIGSDPNRFSYGSKNDVEIIKNWDEYLEKEQEKKNG